MNKYRFAMAVVALFVLGTTAVASGADGEPLLLGRENDNESLTQVYGPTYFNIASASNLSVSGYLESPGIHLNGFSVTGDETNTMFGRVKVPEGQQQLRFQVQASGGSRFNQLAFFQVIGNNPSYTTSYEQRTIPLERDVNFDSVITVYLNKPAPSGGLKLAYWEIGKLPRTP